MYDKTLVKKVHDETCNHWRITAILTRFGGLSVHVWDEDMDCPWQGDNILEARAWATATPYPPQFNKGVTK
jgi:hypothetical protein